MITPILDCNRDVRDFTITAKEEFSLHSGRSLTRLL